MSQDKTEEPTPKKLREARRKGEVPRSKELSTAAVLLASVAALSLSGPGVLESLAASVRLAMGAAASPAAIAPHAALEAGMSLGVRALAPVLVAVLVAGALAAFVQVGPLLALDPIAPKLERVDPLQGGRRLLSQRQLVELLKSLLKIGVIGGVAFAVLEDAVGGVVGLASRDAEAALAAGGGLVLELALRVGAVMAVVGVADVLYQRWRFRQDQKMTKEEVKREHKDAEGDPHAKQQRQRAHREIVEHAVLEEVRRADVLIVNPTHFAVALRYDEEADDAAPAVLAKGRDALARRMIEVAREAGVPVMRDVPLARALHELEIGEEIPEALYEAAAAVLQAAWAEREEAEA